MEFHQKIFFNRNPACTPPQLLPPIIFPVGPLSRLSKRKLFFDETPSVDAVFNAESEYYMHSTQKSIFIGHNLEIPVHFRTFLLWFEYFQYLRMFFIFFLIFEVIF